LPAEEASAYAADYGTRNLDAELAAIERRASRGTHVSTVNRRTPPKLTVGRTYSWDELGRKFGFRPRYFSVGGGMLTVKKLNALLVVTHPRGAKSFDYGDYWERGELVYAGKGLNGHQQLRAENRDAAENRRTNYIFEHAGAQRLKFLGIGRCVDWHPDTAPGRDGKPRRIFRFRFSFNRGQVRTAETSHVATKRGTPSSKPSGPARAQVRQPRKFDPGRAPNSYARGARAPGRTPEEIEALKEKATAAHHQILVELEEALTNAHWLHVEEVPAATDLQGTAPSGIRVLFEAKSLSGRNESSQVRRGLAQLLEYRFWYGSPTDELCLVTDGPIDPRRRGLLRALGIEFVWVDKAGFHESGPLVSDAVRSIVPSAPADANLNSPD
jgi:hypothetical protein